MKHIFEVTVTGHGIRATMIVKDASDPVAPETKRIIRGLHHCRQNLESQYMTAMTEVPARRNMAHCSRLEARIQAVTDLILDIKDGNIHGYGIAVERRRVF